LRNNPDPRGFCIRARLQSCRKAAKVSGALAPEDF
jgi:hypothetical protein